MENRGEIILYQPDEAVRLEVRLEDETVWLTQAQMAELFNSTKQNISFHINNTFKEGELSSVATVKDYLTVQIEGNRTVKRKVSFYNLDVIISVGFISFDIGPEISLYVFPQNPGLLFIIFPFVQSKFSADERR